MRALGGAGGALLGRGVYVARISFCWCFSSYCFFCCEIVYRSGENRPAHDDQFVRVTATSAQVLHARCVLIYGNVFVFVFILAGRRVRGHHPEAATDPDGDGGFFGQDQDH